MINSSAESAAFKLSPPLRIWGNRKKGIFYVRQGQSWLP